MDMLERQQKMQQRRERENLRVGDDVVLEGRDHCIWLGKVKRITPKQVVVGWFNSVPYSKETGAPNGYSRYRLRGLATREELEAWKARLATRDNAQSDEPERRAWEEREVMGDN